MNLYLLNEIYTNGYNAYALNILSALAIMSGICVIISKNPIISILHLIGLFGYVSLYLILIGLHFIALSYLIVYIGAVSILFLFILMLINIRTSELKSNTSNSAPLTVIAGVILSYFLFKILPSDVLTLSYLNDSHLNENIYSTPAMLNAIPSLARASAAGSEQPYKNDLFFITSKIWDANLAENNHITAIGNIMYTNYSIWLIIASFILLLAMVGAIVITIKPRKI